MLPGPADDPRRAHATIAARYQQDPEGYPGVFAEAGQSFGLPAQERVFDWLASRSRAAGGEPWR